MNCSAIDILGDLVDGAKSADWFLGLERGAPVGVVVDEAGDHVGVDHAGADSVDSDAGRGVVECCVEHSDEHDFAIERPRCGRWPSRLREMRPARSRTLR